MHYPESALLTNMLNTQVEGIYANDRFCFYLTESGVLYSTGFDFRYVKRDDLYGVPRSLSFDGSIKEVALGRDHALILS